MSYCNVWAEVVFQKRRCLHNFTMAIFCAAPNSITSLSFRCWSIPISEIREFNRKKEKKKKKMNNSKSDYFRFDTFPTVQMDPFFNQTCF